VSARNSGQPGKAGVGVLHQWAWALGAVPSGVERVFLGAVSGVVCVNK